MHLEHEEIEEVSATLFVPKLVNLPTSLNWTGTVQVTHASRTRNSSVSAGLKWGFESGRPKYSVYCSFQSDLDPSQTRTVPGDNFLSQPGSTLEMKIYADPRNALTNRIAEITNLSTRRQFNQTFESALKYDTGEQDTMTWEIDAPRNKSKKFEIGSLEFISARYQGRDGNGRFEVEDMNTDVSALCSFCA